MPHLYSARDSASVAPDYNDSACGVELYHQKLGNVGKEAIKRMVRENVAYGLDLRARAVSARSCTPCMETKMARGAIIPHTLKSQLVGDVIHSELCGQMTTTTSIGDARYF